MFHTDALFTPATGYQRTTADIEAVALIEISRFQRF